MTTFRKEFESQALELKVGVEHEGAQSQTEPGISVEAYLTLMDILASDPDRRPTREERIARFLGAMPEGAETLTSLPVENRGETATAIMHAVASRCRKILPLMSTPRGKREKPEIDGLLDMFTARREIIRILRLGPDLKVPTGDIIEALNMIGEGDSVFSEDNIRWTDETINGCLHRLLEELEKGEVTPNQSWLERKEWAARSFVRIVRMAKGEINITSPDLSRFPILAQLQAHIDVQGILARFQSQDINDRLTED